jgi:hypothetical protein
MRHRLCMPSHLIERICQVIMSVGVQGIQGKHTPAGVDGLTKFLLISQDISQLEPDTS